ncbi:hypothetical protein B0H14DRAFT_2718787 [Mycena olivaceomarginata]|nr:hypothetical protein B0H14DRAFT_2718787 [Mycena olivaceomarginata]
MNDCHVLDYESKDLEGPIPQDFELVEPGTYVVKSGTSLPYGRTLCIEDIISRSSPLSKEVSSWCGRCLHFLLPCLRSYRHGPSDDINPGMNASLVMEVRARDEDQCVLTSGNDTTLKWIMPPALLEGVVDRDFIEECAKSAANVITLSKEAAALFSQNKVGIDIDDKNAVVRFQQMACAFESSASLPGVSGTFLRLHFQHCLRVQLQGGDIKTEFSPDYVGQLWEDYQETRHTEHVKLRGTFERALARQQFEDINAALEVFQRDASPASRTTLPLDEDSVEG